MLGVDLRTSRHSPTSIAADVRYDERSTRLQHAGSNRFFNSGADVWLGVVEHTLRGE
jgi:hypothetical protein